MVPHRLRTITIVDQILIVDGRKVVEEGRHSELVDAGELYIQQVLGKAPEGERVEGSRVIKSLFSETLVPLILFRWQNQ